MRKYTRILFFLLTISCSWFAKEAKASHVAGADLIYEWVSDSTYRFYFKFYRDCSGIDEPPFATLCYYNQCNTQNGSTTLNKIAFLPGGISNGQEVSPGCAGSFTTCAGGRFPGYREWWYSATVTLPSRCDYWTFYVAVNSGNGNAGRNPNDNITPSPANPLAPNGIIYIEATLNNKDAQGFSSPYFSVKPVPYVCLNSPVVYSNGPVDPNNDVMRFEMIPPRDIQSVFCVPNYSAFDMAFTRGYTLAQPFACNNTFNLNNITSQISFTPALISSNTVSMRANKFRNGVKLGSVMRDIQFQVVQCATPLPTYTLIQSSISGAKEVSGVLEGNVNKTINFCFYLKSISGSILSVTDNHGLVIPTSGIIYNNMGKDSVNGCFSWTPSCNDTGLKLLAITVKDSTCQALGSTSVAQTYIIPINIAQAAVTTFRKLTICPGDAITINAASGAARVSWMALPGGSPTSTLSCDTCRTPIARPEITTTYIARYRLPRMDTNSCFNEDQVMVQVNPAKVEVTPPGPLSFCNPDSLRLDANVAGGSTRLSNLECGSTATTPTTPIDSTEVLFATAPAQSITNPVSTPFTGDSTTARHQYLVRAGDMRASGMSGGTIKSLSFKVSTLASGAGTFAQFRISLLCTTLSSLNAAAGFIPGTVPVYTATAPITIASSGAYATFEFNTPYNWDTTQNLLIDICYANATPVSPAFTYYFNTSYISSLHAYANSGSLCGATATINPVPELPQMKFNYYLAPAASDFSYRWGGSTFVPSDSVKSPSTFINTSKQITVATQDRYGCILRDTLSVILTLHGVITADTPICAGETVKIPAPDGRAYKWYENGFNTPTTLDCNICPFPNASPLVTTTYTSLITDEANCIDTFRYDVIVTPLPNVDILNGDTTIGFEQELQLVATGAGSYVWWPGNTLNNAYIPNPIARPNDYTTYSVIGASAENARCFGYDTVHVSIDYKGKIFVPNAFTPNADGKNDRFKVVNLSFQKLVEFKVFNRWGQELYNALDNIGWDGTWKGQPQPMGVYYYLVKISYPDGTEKSMNGDFTLIR